MWPDQFHIERERSRETPQDMPKWSNRPRQRLPPCQHRSNKAKVTEALIYFHQTGVASHSVIL
jgi:hypothetical protein